MEEQEEHFSSETEQNNVLKLKCTQQYRAMF